MTVDREVSLRIDRLNEKVAFFVMEHSPLVLSLGKKCLEQGYGLHWYPGAQQVLVTPKGRKITLGLEGYVPVLPMTAAQREAKAASSSTASSSTTPPPKSVLKKPPEEEDVVVEPSTAKAEANSTVVDPDSAEFEAKATRDLRKDPNSVHHQLTHTPKLSNCDSCVRAKM